MTDPARIVTVQTSLATRSAAQAGFSMPIILGAHNVFADRVRAYTKPADLITDGFVATDPIYMAASAIFAQSPTVPMIKVGKLQTGLQAPVLTLTPVVQNRGQYTVTINGVSSSATPPVTLTPTVSASPQVVSFTLNGATYSYSAAASATAATIVTGLLAAYTAAPQTGITASGTGTLILTMGPNVLPALSYTSNLVAGNNTAAEIVTALNAAMAASSNQGLFVRTGTVTSILTGSTAGLLPVLGVSQNLLIQNTTPAQTASGFATDMAAIQAADDAWYLGLLVGQGPLEILAAASFFESTKKMLFVQSADDDVVSTDYTATPISSSDVLNQLKGLQRNRTALFFSRTGSLMHDAAAGSFLSQQPGSATMAFRPLVGVSAEALSATQENRLAAKSGNWQMNVSGLLFSSNTGTMASGRHVDTQIFVDYCEARISEGIITALANAPKIPYTDEGISAITGIIRGFLLSEEARGTIVRGSTLVTAPKRVNTSQADRANRILRNVEYSFVYTGAVHSVVVSGSISI